MKLKNTFILLLAAGAIMAFIYFYENKQPTTQEIAKRVGRVLPTIDRDKITGITIKNTDTKIQLSKKDGSWYLDAPLKDRADSMAVNQLFTAAEGLKSDESIPTDKQGGGKDLLKDFGLANPETRLTLTGGDKPVEVLFGKDAAMDGKMYVRLEDSKEAHVVSNDLKNQLAKKVDDFRDHKLTDLLTTQVDKVLLKTSSGEIELDKKDQHWALAKPFKARGNDQTVNDLISRAANAQIESFVADASDLAKFGLQDPRGSVTFTSEGAKAPVVLQIGKEVEKDKDKEKDNPADKNAGKIYVKLSTRDAVMIVPKAVETILDTTPSTVRDRNLIRVSPDIVDRMTIESPGKEKIVLARQGESWGRKADGKDLPVNVAAASRLLNTLQNEQVSDFVADVATDLPKYGLDHPTETITLSSFASENTAETKAGEKPIVSILFGKTDGDKVYAKLDDEPFVVSIPKPVLDVAMTDPLQWQELAIFKDKPEDITSVEVAHEGLPTVSLTRDKDKNWVLAKGDGKVNETSMDSMLNTLSNLRAVRWIGATAPDQGLDKPKTVVSFKTAAGERKLSLGGQTTEKLTYGAADGLTGTFAISEPDASAFQLPLLVGALPIPTLAPPTLGAPPAPGAPGITPAPPALTPPPPGTPTTPPVPAAPPAIPPAPPATPPAAPSITPALPATPAPVPPPPPAPATPNPAPAPSPATPVPAPATPAPATPNPTTPAPATPAPATPAPATPTPATPTPATPTPATPTPATPTPATPTPATPTPPPPPAQN